MKIQEKINRIIKIMQPDSSRTAIANAGFDYKYFVYLEYKLTRLDTFKPKDRLDVEDLLQKICDNKVCFFITIK